MKKQKFGETDSLANEWCKYFSNMLYKYFGDDFDPRIAGRICSSECSKAEMREILHKYPKIMDLIDSRNKYVTAEEGDKAARLDAIRDFDSFMLMMSWGKNKKVYHFDRDFTNELIKTDDMRFTKDMFDFLPHKYMYIDISDNEELCKKIQAKGFFVTVEKVSADWQENYINECAEVPDYLKYCEKWAFHICKVDELHFYHDLIFFPNTDKSIDAKEVMSKGVKQSKIIRPVYSEEGVEYEEFDVALFTKLVQHTLTYLTSVDPDIRESELTKRTYKEPSQIHRRPKDKFSEVQIWDVGVRYGDAFRKWKSEEPRYRSVSTGTGRKLRPHSRRAHYNYYWYGKRNSEDRVLRRVWIDELFINVDKDKTEDLPVVIHKVKNDKSNIERD